MDTQTELNCYGALLRAESHIQGAIKALDQTAEQLKAARGNDAEKTALESIRNVLQGSAESIGKINRKLID